MPRAKIAPFGLEVGAECFDVMLGVCPSFKESILRREGQDTRRERTLAAHPKRPSPCLRLSNPRRCANGAPQGVPFGRLWTWGAVPAVRMASGMRFVGSNPSTNILSDSKRDAWPHDMGTAFSNARHAHLQRVSLRQGRCGGPRASNDQHATAVECFHQRCARVQSALESGDGLEVCSEGNVNASGKGCQIVKRLVE